MGNQEIDLEALVRLVRDEFKFEEILVICNELGLDCEEWGIKSSQSEMLNALFLVGKVYRLGRTNELLKVLEKLREHISEQVPERLLESWEVINPLSNRVIEKVNDFLGRPGKPYIIVENPSYLTNWQPTSRQTGCYCWLFEKTVMELFERSENQSLWKTCFQTKDFLKDEPVIVYISYQRAWHETGQESVPCIVVAPTTNKFDSLRIEQTESGNCGFGTIEWIRYLTYLEEQCSFDIIAATDHYVEVQFNQLPTTRDLQILKESFHDRFATREEFSDYQELTIDDFGLPILLVCDD